MQGTFKIRNQRVRSQSMRRFIVVRLGRTFDGVRYGDFTSASIEKRSDSLAVARTFIDRQGFHSSRLFLIVDTVTGEEV